METGGPATARPEYYNDWTRGRHSPASSWSASDRHGIRPTSGLRRSGIWLAIINICWSYDKTLGTSGQSDAYTAALASIEAGIGFVVGAVYAETLSARVHGQTIRMFTNNRTVLIALRAPAKRTRQWIIGGILKHVEFLKGFAFRVVFA
jgi:hypothetical protein